MVRFFGVLGAEVVLPHGAVHGDICQVTELQMLQRDITGIDEEFLGLAAHLLHHLLDQRRDGAVVIILREHVETEDQRRIQIA
jgi:hypothetical protein